MQSAQEEEHVKCCCEFVEYYTSGLVTEDKTVTLIYEHWSKNESGVEKIRNGVTSDGVARLATRSITLKLIYYTTVLHCLRNTKENFGKGSKKVCVVAQLRFRAHNSTSNNCCHSPYSPDLAPSDPQFFQCWKKKIFVGLRWSIAFQKMLCVFILRETIMKNSKKHLIFITFLLAQSGNVYASRNKSEMLE